MTILLQKESFGSRKRTEENGKFKNYIKTGIEAAKSKKRITI